jgi:hypothetical protein
VSVFVPFHRADFNHCFSITFLPAVGKIWNFNYFSRAGHLVIRIAFVLAVHDSAGSGAGTLHNGGSAALGDMIFDKSKHLQMIQTSIPVTAICLSIQHQRFGCFVLGYV